MFARSTNKRAPWSLLALAAVNLGLGAVMALELLAPGRVAAFPASSAAHVTNEALPGNDFSLPALSAYETVTQRPLFARNRRPRPPQAAAVATGDANSFVLAGVTISGGQRTAFIRHGSPPVVATLAEGQETDGWTVREITDDHVVLRNESTDFTIRLYRQPAPAKP